MTKRQEKHANAAVVGATAADRAGSGSPVRPDSRPALPSASPFPASLSGLGLPLIAGIAAVLLFILLTSAAIEEQGLYYDELHQAPASFMLLGKPRYVFTPLAWGQLPLLTMPYSGAVKSILYGSWMKVSGVPFSVAGWRLFGIGLVAAGLFGFCVMTARRLTLPGMAVFLLLFLTDATVLLTSRHDWGPTAVALMLRLVWIGLWIRSESEEASAPLGWFVLGFIPAFSIYEKLNNVVLLGPLVLVVLLSPRPRVLRRSVLAGAGFLAGLIPFLLVNALTRGISFQEYAKAAASPGGNPVLLKSLPSLVGRFLAMGDGQEVKKFILGVPPTPGAHLAELSFVVLLLGGAGLLAWRTWSVDQDARLAGISLLSYASVCVLIFTLLPKGTWVHHWMAGTPFQYVALAMAVPVMRRARVPGTSGFTPSLPAVPRRRAAALLLASFVLLRGYGLAATEKDLFRGKASLTWDPSFTIVARFAAQHWNEAIFVAADWGFATQIYSLSNGAFPVLEPIWGWEHGRGPDLLREYLAQKPGRPVYVLVTVNPVRPLVTRDIVNAVSALAGGEQSPLEEDLANLKSVKVIKFGPPS